MKNIFSLILLILSLSCNNTIDTKQISKHNLTFKKISVQLVDSLGTVELSIPTRYDTNFSWINYSDCGKPCDKQEYRFQSKKIPIAKESGWFWNGESKDSVDNFTITHSSYVPFHDGRDTGKIIPLHQGLKNRFINEFNSVPIIFDTIEKVNDRYFYIFAMEKHDTTFIKKVIAVSSIKTNEIIFQYKLVTQKNDSTTKNFIKNSIDLIKTIKISKGL